MKIKLRNASDLVAVQTVVGSPDASLTIAIAMMANSALDNENFEVIIDKALLPDTYKSNPTALASKIQAKAYEQFPDFGGWQTPDTDGKFVTIVLMRERKPDAARRSHPQPSAKHLIKEWLTLDLPRLTLLDVPIDIIPPFFRTHPEQLSYQIKRETLTAITIRRYTKKWTIQRQ